MKATQWLENENNLSSHFVEVGAHGRVYTETEVICLLNKYKPPEDDGIVGKLFFVDAAVFQGVADVVSVNDDDTVQVRSAWSGKIYTVQKADILKEVR